MTRGTIYCITDTFIVHTTEFNGDMYPEGHGLNVIKGLKKVKSIEEFNKFAEDFNDNKHNYTGNITHLDHRSIIMRGDKISMTDENYYEKFFSDWIFIKNLSTKEVIISTREKKTISLLPGEQVAINFGHFEDNYKTEEEGNEIIKLAEEARKIKTIKETSLRYRQGTSDKEYHVQIKEVGLDSYIVNFQFGKTGKNFTGTGTKTPVPVSLGRAQFEYSKIVDQKIQKGYR